MSSIGDSLFSGVLAVVVVGGVFLLIWSKISGKPIKQIIKEMLSDDE
jgi:hypothetical protein